MSVLAQLCSSPTRPISRALDVSVLVALVRSFVVTAGVLFTSGCHDDDQGCSFARESALDVTFLAGQQTAVIEVHTSGVWGGDVDFLPAVLVDQLGDAGVGAAYSHLEPKLKDGGGFVVGHSPACRMDGAVGKDEDAGDAIRSDGDEEVPDERCGVRYLTGRSRLMITRYDATEAGIVRVQASVRANAEDCAKPRVGGTGVSIRELVEVEEEG